MVWPLGDKDCGVIEGKLGFIVLLASTRRSAIPLSLFHLLVICEISSKLVCMGQFVILILLAHKVNFTLRAVKNYLEK